MAQVETARKNKWYILKGIERNIYYSGKVESLGMITTLRIWRATCSVGRRFLANCKS